MSPSILFVCKSQTDLFFGTGVKIFLSVSSLVHPPVLKRYCCHSRALQQNVRNIFSYCSVTIWLIQLWRVTTVKPRLVHCYGPHCGVGGLPETGTVQGGRYLLLASCTNAVGSQRQLCSIISAISWSEVGVSKNWAYESDYNSGTQCHKDLTYKIRLLGTLTVS